MTEQLYCESLRKILTNKKQIEDSLNVKLTTKGKIIFIDGDPADELIGLEVIEAMELGFSVSEALDLKNEEFKFEKIYIKSLEKRRDLSQVRARIIGTQRRALKNIESLTNCDIVLHDNVVGIIGRVDDVRKAAYALKKLIGGSKHANVYTYLEEENLKEKAGVW
jgi:ribosomal RNA assembly protein